MCGDVCGNFKSVIGGGVVRAERFFVVVVGYGVEGVDFVG